LPPDAPPRPVEQLRDALAVTRADLGRLAARADAFLASVSGRTPTDIEVYGGGALLHGYYNTLERCLERVARDLNAAPPEGPDWHRLLLRTMALDKPGRRPAIFDDGTASDLARYLGFRHVFRHLYVLDLRWDQVRSLLGDLAPLHRRVDEQLARFDGFLAQLAAAPA
jgi:ribonuclease HepT-like protein